MSTTYTTYLMLGIKTTKEESGIDIWDDKWLPYIEGDEELDISIQYNEDSNDLYIGKILDSWSKEDGLTCTELPLTEFIVDSQTYDASFYWEFLRSKLPHLQDKEFSLLFFTTAH